jgi:hypothetical protein
VHNIVESSPRPKSLRPAICVDCCQLRRRVGGEAASPIRHCRQERGRYTRSPHGIPGSGGHAAAGTAGNPHARNWISVSRDVGYTPLCANDEADAVLVSGPRNDCAQPSARVRPAGLKTESAGRGPARCARPTDGDDFRRGRWPRNSASSSAQPVSLAG